MKTRMALISCIAMIAFSPLTAAAQAPDTLPMPGSRIRVWLGTSQTPVKGVLLGVNDGVLRVDDGGLTCGADGCGALSASLSSVSRLQVGRRRASAAVIAPLVAVVGIVATALTASRCDSLDSTRSVGCESKYFVGVAGAAGLAFILSREHWVDVKLPPLLPVPSSPTPPRPGEGR